MSGYAYKCPVCGGGFAENDGPVMCCGDLRHPYPCGVTASREGAPMIISDEIHEYKFDSAAGRSFDTRTERKAWYKAHGLKRTSVREAQNSGLMGDHTRKHHFTPGRLGEPSYRTGS